MSVIYKSKILLKTGYGYPGNILDLGEFGYDVSNNKAWAGNGIGNPPTGIVMDPSYNYLYNLVQSMEASTGNYATITYVDGSLLSRDLSINNLFIENDAQDVSIAWLRQYQLIQDASIEAFEANDVTFVYVDGSLSARDASITKLFNQDFTINASLGLRPLTTYVDGSLNLKVNKTLFDSSIASLTNKNISQDASILLRPLTTYVDGSLNLKVNKTLFDSSIAALTTKNTNQDTSINNLWVSQGLQDTSIAWLRQYQLIQDASIAAFEANDVTFAYVDGSLATRDASISDLYDIATYSSGSNIDISNNIINVVEDPSFLSTTIVTDLSLGGDFLFDYGNTITVAKTGTKYDNINDAIAVADASTVIFVSPGNYIEDISINKNINLVGSCGKKTKITGKVTFTHASSSIIFKNVGFYNENDHAIDVQCTDDDGKISLIDCYVDTVWNTGSGQSTSTAKSNFRISRGQLAISRGRYSIIASGDNTSEHNTSIYWLRGGSKKELNVFGTFHTITNTTDERQNLEVIFNTGTNSNSLYEFKNGNIKFYGVIDSDNYTAPFYSISALGEYGIIEGNLIEINDTGNAYCAFNYGSSIPTQFTNNSIVPKNVSDLYAAWSDSGEINVVQCYFDTTTLPQISGNVNYGITTNTGAFLSGGLSVDNKVNLGQYTNTSGVDGDFWYTGSELNIRVGTNTIDLLNNSGDVTFAYVDGSLATRDASINKNIVDILSIESSLGSYVKKTGDTMTGNLVITTDLSVNGKGNFGKLNVSGSSFPAVPTAGDMFYRPDLVQMFLYDASRGKWLSMDRATYTSGTASVLSSTTSYMSVGDGDMSSINGFRMPKNGTILGAAIQNRITVTSPRTMSIRVNDVSVYSLTIPSGLGVVGTNANTNFNKNDIIQIAIEEGGTTIRDVITSVEVAWRE